MHHQKPMLGTQLDWSNPLNKGLVMHLAMNEGHGDRVQDLSLNNNHGTLEGFAYPPTVASGWNPGRTGVGLNTDGTNDYITCGNQANLHTLKAFTISAWVKSADNTGNRTITEHLNSVILRVADDVLYIKINVGASWYNATCAYTSNEWDNIVAVYDNSWAIRKARIYVNGVEVTYTLQQTVAAGSITTPTSDLTIAGRVGSNFAIGSVDQCRILNRAMTTKEVLDDYINPNGVYLEE